MTSIHSSTCRFCSVADGASQPSVADRPWMSNSAYMALVSVGALVPGWSLVIPRAHRLNMAADLTLAEGHEFIASVVARVEAQFGPAAVFEHGCASSESQTGCGVGHAHLHVVPLAFELVSAARAFDPDRRWDYCKLQDVAAMTNGREYLFAANRYEGAATEGSFTILEEGISQFFRRVIARELGRDDEYNYREFPQMDTVVQSHALLTMPSEIAA